MKATRRSEAPVETMRDESSLMIIEKEEEAMDGNGRKGKNVVKVVQLFLRWVAVTWNPLGEDHLSQRKKAGRVEAKETSRESWGLNYFEKFGAHHVGCVGGDVNDGGDVEENHDLPCNLSIDWNATNSSTRTATNNILSCYYCGFLFFFYKYLHAQVSVFLLDSWTSCSHYVSVLLSIWQLKKLDLCKNFKCISQILL